MPSRLINGIEYDLVAEFEENGQGNIVARTIVGEGKTPVNTYRLRVSERNPLTAVPFNNNMEALLHYAINQCSQRTWDKYWEDPAPEEGE